MVGGAPLTQEYADQIGADGYGRDATAAVRVARQLMSGAPEGVASPGGAG
jgi:5-methyltetrahydrofolate--homocysteine methyltransferase